MSNDDSGATEQQNTDTQCSTLDQVAKSSLPSRRTSIPPLGASRYSHALAVLSPTFPRLRDTLKGVIALQTADNLVRGDAPEFLLEQLPIWEGPWKDSQLPSLSSSDSLTDRLVKICRRMDSLERLSPMDGLGLRFHRVLQYQLYLRYEQEVIETVVTKPKSMKNSSIALELFLAQLYSDDWTTVGQEVKDKRKDKFHYRKTVGKRFQILCDNLGYGVLLLGSRAAMRTM